MENNTFKKKNRFVLLAGGLGYIGTNVAYQILANLKNDSGGEEADGVIIVDNCENSSLQKLHELRNLFQINPKGKSPEEIVIFRQFDIAEELTKLYQVFEEFTNIVAVINLAGAKSVPESISHPERYFKNMTIQAHLLEVMKEYECFNLIFSSSATVYGEHQSSNRFTEDMTVDPSKTSSPYGFSKATIEKMLEQCCLHDSRWKIICLRYFNPAGRIERGFLEEMPLKKAKNVFPHLLECTIDDRKTFQIYGNDHPTSDGTPERDYVHISDLAFAHYLSLRHFKQGFHVYNVGTGKPISVLQLVKAFEKYSGQKVNYSFASRRKGDAPTYFADTTKFASLTGWKPKYDFEDIVKGLF